MTDDVQKPEATAGDAAQEAQTPLGEGSPNTSAESSTGSQTIENSAGSSENGDPNVQAGSAATMTPDSASLSGDLPNVGSGAEDAGPLPSTVQTLPAVASQSSDAATAASGTVTSGELPGEGAASDVADPSESGIASSAQNASPAASSVATAAGSQSSRSYHPDDPRPRIMAFLAVARAHLQTIESDVARNVHGALDGIEELLGMKE